MRKIKSNNNKWKNVLLSTEIFFNSSQIDLKIQCNLNENPTRFLLKTGKWFLKLYGMKKTKQKKTRKAKIIWKKDKV